MKLDTRVHTALDVLQGQGFEAFVVGGCVRDSLMGLTPKDWDVCTSALPSEVLGCFGNYPVHETGLKHGTITVLIEQLPVEITTYRQDGTYEDCRRPSEVTFVRSLEEDLARRDFTMNALAYHPAGGLTDPFGGAEDIHNKLIRCVGDPAKRFNEDGLRIMRALRFASLLGFELEEHTAEAVHSHKELLQKVSAERLAHELTQLLKGRQVCEVLLKYSDVLEVFIPEIKSMVGTEQNNPYHLYDIWGHTVRSVAAAPASKVVRLAMLFHDSGKPSTRSTDAHGIGHFYGHSKKSVDIAHTVLKRLRFDTKTIEAVVELITWHDTTIQVQKVARWLARLGEERFEQLLQVQEADLAAKSNKDRQEQEAHIAALWQRYREILEEQQCFRLKDLAISGDDLITLGMEPGTLLGCVLNELLGSVMDGKLPNEKQALLAAARQLAHPANFGSLAEGCNHPSTATDVLCKESKFTG
ncbi:MAG: HD domain-containing protein [Coriobacteriia bacterium]|nr:HD domain-containing protein [Coriobacteriia bacterium]